VDHRGPDAVSLRRVHPVAEVEDVEAADEALGRRPARAAPRGAPRVREREDREPEVDVDPVEGLADQPRAAAAGRRPGEDLVLPAGGLDEPGERSPHVVSDPGPLVRERADVEDDPHGS
jgi:hypothetical protein